MSELKATPGPWFFGIAYEPESGPVEYDYKGPGHYRNAGIFGADGEMVVGCGEYDVFNTTEDIALLVAAPELYEALDLLYEHCRLYHRNVETNNVGEVVRAAMKKARGETA